MYRKDAFKFIMKNIIQHVRLTFLSNIFCFSLHIRYIQYYMIFDLRLLNICTLIYNIALYIITYLLLNYVRSIMSFTNSYGSIKIKILCDFILGYKSLYFIMEKKYLDFFGY